VEARLEKVENSEAYIEITVDAELFEEGLEKAYRKVVKQVTVPGFRRGRVPRALLEAHYGKEILYQDAMEYIIPDAYSQAIDELDIEPIARPDFDFGDFDKIEAGKGFTFNARVAVKPEFALPDLTGLEVEVPAFNVTDQDVENRLQDMRNRYAELVEKTEGTAANRDIVEIDFEGFVDGEAFPGGKGFNYELELGSGTFIPGFEEQVVGMAVGESKEINVTFPESYGAEELAGKDAVFKVYLHKITTRRLRPLDDEFAQEVSSFDTIAELRDDIRNNLEKMVAARRKDIIKQKVINGVLERCEIPIPDSVVEVQLERMLDQMGQRLAAQGMTIEQYFEYTQSTVEDFNREMWPEALRMAKTNLLLEKVIEEKGFTASDEEIESRMAETAAGMGVELEKVKDRLMQLRKGIEFSIETDKAVDYLIENVIIKEEDDNPGVQSEEDAAL